LALGFIVCMHFGLVVQYKCAVVLFVNIVSVSGLVGNANIDFSDVCRYYLGRWAEILSVIFSLIALLGGAVVYWVLMSNFLFHTVTFIHGLLIMMNTINISNTGNNNKISWRGSQSCCKGDELGHFS